MITGIGRWAGMVLAFLFLIFSMPVAAFAAARGTPAPLTLDPAFIGDTGNPAESEPSALRDCDAFPDGAVKKADGWKFDQPVTGATPLAYTVAFFEIIGGGPQPRVFGITAAGVVQVDPAAPTSTLPLTAGVSGALTGDGAWIRTPAGWRLAGGALQLAGEAAGGGTFALTAVCLPVTTPATSPATSPSAASPSPSATSPSPSASASATPSSTSTAPAGGLPITGGRTGTVALAGLAIVLAGVLISLAVRRGATRFRA